MERFVELIEKDIDRLIDAIDVHMNAGGFALAVVGDDDVLPFMQLYRRFGLEANAQVGPAVNDVDAELAIDEVESLARSFEVVFRARHDTAVGRIRVDGYRKREGIQIAEIRDLFIA